MLLQTRGGGGGDSTSVGCLFSINSPEDEEEEEAEERRRRRRRSRRFNVGRIPDFNNPPASQSSRTSFAGVKLWPPSIRIDPPTTRA